MNPRKIGIVIAAALLVIVIAANRKNVTLVKQDNFEWNSISASGGELKSVIHLRNPNLLSSTIKSIDEKFSVNGNVVGELSNELNQGIAGMKDTEFPVSVRISKDDIRKITGINVDSSQEKILIAIDGEINFANLTGGGTIKIHQTENILLK